MKPLILALIFILKQILSFASPTILSPGDIAVISFNFEDPDCFSFVTFVDIAPGTIIYFTDCGWKDDNSFREGEGLITYVVPDPGKQAMSVINYPDDPGFTTQGISGFFGFAEAGDQILVFQGNFATPIFIFGINNSSTSWQSSAIDNNSSSLPLGLEDRISAIALNEKINYEFNCLISSGSKADILAAIANPINWIGSNSSRVSFPNTCFRESLPVNIVSLTGTREVDQNLITFVVSGEENIEHYEIQRSEDGSFFYTIGNVRAGNSTDKATYSFADYANNNIYYRIKVVEANVSLKFSKIVYIEAVDGLEVISYMILDVNGKILLKEDMVKISEGEIMSKLKNIPQGFYIVKLISSQGEVNKQVLKE